MMLKFGIDHIDSLKSETNLILGFNWLPAVIQSHLFHLRLSSCNSKFWNWTPQHGNLDENRLKAVKPGSFPLTSREKFLASMFQKIFNSLIWNWRKSSENWSHMIMFCSAVVLRQQTTKPISRKWQWNIFSPWLWTIKEKRKLISSDIET